MVSGDDLQYRRAKLDQFLQVTSPRLDELFGLVGNAGCGVLLTDADGVILDMRCTDGDAKVFQDWGLRHGADWSEASEGTNGIGTCLTEQRHITIHRDEHFFARNAGMSCMDAPIFGANGQIIAALDVSSARADQTESYNRLIGATVAQIARHIEGDYFRTTYAGRRIVCANRGDTDTALLAIDADDIVVGATRAARQAFGLQTEGAFAPCPASDLFGREDDEATGFARAERTAVVRALTRSNGNVSQAARALGVGRATLYRRMKRLGITENMR